MFLNYSVFLIVTNIFLVIEKGFVPTLWRAYALTEGNPLLYTLLTKCGFLVIFKQDSQSFSEISPVISNNFCPFI